ncbi:XrtA/PEP-CTERM system TPR-repeat protein PrsT [Enterovibrio paralichthyis]|uniref:XrtA/PEP-CTERM system TPR-repeat protein PrsT n=1 Tax=Enterovibrio paralichthyis TaxID=2853805 RepID=UPI001C462105|nr:XrtA/PEP-CTERM system TPR-repeat protein PrsT [Enterovibrio paralichthyis]MBV7299792.1 PEP-CTERM system TPR-repeat protein PrsT [Enterovibrio paralichthyis]
MPTYSQAKDYVKSAEEYLSENDVSAAVIELKNAIKEDPQQALPRFMLGEIHLSEGRFANAEKEFSRALEYGYDPNVVLPLLARSLLNENQPQGVRQLIDDYGTTPAPNDLYAIAAIAEVRLGDLGAAADYLKKAGDNTLYARLAEATYLSATNQLDAAISDVDSLLKNYPASSDAWLLKGHLASAKNDYGTAYNSYTKAYELAPDATQYNIFIANALVNAQRFDEAEPLVDGILAINNQFPAVNEMKAVILYSKEDFAGAKTYADRALVGNDDSVRATMIAGISAVRLGQYEQAYQRLSTIASELPRNHLANRLLIMTQLELGNVNDALAALNDYESATLDDAKFLSQASVALAKLGRNEEALVLAKRASVFEDSRIESALGLAKLANNEISGIENLQAAIDADPDSKDAKVALTNYLLARGMQDDANTIADNWLQKNPKDTVALMVKGLLLKEKGDLNGARDYFNQIREIEPSNVQSLAALAEIENLKNNKKQAIALLKQAKEIAPTNYSVSHQYITLSHEFGDLPRAMATIDEQLKADPFNAQLKVQKALALVLSGDNQAAINLLEGISDTDRYADVWRLLGNVYLASDNVTDAKRNYRRLLEVTPNDPNAFLQLIQLASMQSRIDEGLVLIDRAQKQFPNDIRFPIIKAGLYINNGEIDAGQKVLDSLPEALKNAPYALQLQGRVYIAQKKLPAAIDAYTKRYNAEPSVQTARELASVYSLNGDNEEGAQFLETAIGDFGEKAQPLKILLAELQLRTSPQKAEKSYKAILAENPHNPVALNNLAWLYMELNDIEQACDYAKKAHDIASRSYEIVDTYGYCLLKKGDTDKALELLEMAYRSRPNNAEIALHFAEGLVSVGKYPQATEVLSVIETDDPELMNSKINLHKQIVKE